MPVHQQDFSRPLRTVTIFGPGLIGGSVALAIQQRHPACALKFWARPASVPKTQKAFPSAEVSDDPAAAVSGSDMVVFCCPVEAMEDLARQAVDGCSPDTLITDAGSVKGPVVSALEPIFKERFVGAHPMAGSEQSGLEAASADLFEGATCILTPTLFTAPKALEQVSRFWVSLGCRISEVEPEEHDCLVALSSHLPHALASILVNTVATSESRALDVIGNGFRDTSRIAAGPPAMWAGIFLANRGQVLESLQDFQSELEEFTACLQSGNHTALEKFLVRAAEIRKNLK